MIPFQPKIMTSVDVAAHHVYFMTHNNIVRLDTRTGLWKEVGRMADEAEGTREMAGEMTGMVMGEAPLGATQGPATAQGRGLDGPLGPIRQELRALRRALGRAGIGMHPEPGGEGAGSAEGDTDTVRPEYRPVLAYPATNSPFTVAAFLAAHQDEFRWERLRDACNEFALDLWELSRMAIQLQAEARRGEDEPEREAGTRTDNALEAVSFPIPRHFLQRFIEGRNWASGSRVRIRRPRVQMARFLIGKRLVKVQEAGGGLAPDRTAERYLDFLERLDRAHRQGRVPGSDRVPVPDPRDGRLIGEDELTRETVMPPEPESPEPPEPPAPYEDPMDRRLDALLDALVNIHTTLDRLLDCALNIQEHLLRRAS